MDKSLLPLPGKTFIEENISYYTQQFFLGIALWVHIENILMIPTPSFLFYFRKKKYVYYSFILFILLFSSLLSEYFQGLSFKSFYSSDQGTWVEDSLKQTPIQLVKIFSSHLSISSTTLIFLYS
jgi:hypothetical protein